MASTQWLFLQSWKSQHKDPCLKQASCPRNNLCQPSLCPCQPLQRLRDLLHPMRKGVNVCCFMLPSKTSFIAFSISSNMILVPQFKLFNSLLYNIESSITSHRLGTDSNINSVLCHRLVLHLRA